MSDHTDRVSRFHLIANASLCICCGWKVTYGQRPFYNSMCISLSKYYKISYNEVRLSIYNSQIKSPKVYPCYHFLVVIIKPSLNLRWKLCGYFLLQLFIPKPLIHSRNHLCVFFEFLWRGEVIIIPPSSWLPWEWHFLVEILRTQSQGTEQ